jgi:hypothetical protein
MKEEVVWLRQGGVFAELFALESVEAETLPASEGFELGP